jgi:hypothetical protein
MVQVGSRQPKGTPMTFKCPCPHCGVHLEFDEGQADQVVDCPNCSKTVYLRLPSYHAAAEEGSHKFEHVRDTVVGGVIDAADSAARVGAKITKIRNPNRARLQAARDKSCYRSARIFGKVIFGMGFCYGIASAIAFAVSNMVSTPLMLASLAVAFLSVVFWQFFVLGFDVADVIIDQCRRDEEARTP